MKSWSIRKQIIMLALLPVLFVGLGLVVYFTYTQIEYIDNSLIRHGQANAKQIAPAAEYAVFSGNTDLIKPTLENALNDPDVVAISISDRQGQVLITLRDKKPLPEAPSIWDKWIKTQTLSFKVPIVSQQVSIDDLNEAPQGDTGRQTESDTIGYVNLYVSTYFSDINKISILNRAAILALIILAAGLIFTMRVSRQIAGPVMLLTDTVRRIASGDFKTRVTQDAPGELGVLETYVNSMASELQSYQEEMESRIDDFTQELQQTLEELELRNAELDITRSNALSASRAKSEFLANMSHEIRTPLCGIMGFAELIDHTQVDEKQRDYITTIRKSADSLLNIIDDILDLSKIESGKLEISPVEFNLLHIIEEVIDLLSTTAYEKGIELFYNLHKDTPRQIEADPVRIRQVLINLIGNAIKFTDKGYVFLDIERINDMQNTCIRFSVIDTGIGMSQSSKQTLFHAFTQADTTITRRFGGTGLGLVISRKLTLLMKGSIDFDSVENEGSRFWFQIPVVMSDEVSEFGDALAGLSVKVIASTNMCFSALRSMLEYWGCHVIDPLNNHSAMHLEPDVTITCINHKYLSRIKAGNDICDNSTSRHHHLAIISSNNPDDIEYVLKAGIENVLIFSTPQKQIFQTLCKLTNTTDNPDGNTKPIQHEISPDFSGIHVLVVDDNAINLRLAEILLNQHGAHVVTAASGNVAIEIIEKNTFDIIFMDLHMPGLDGYAVTERIRLIETEQKSIIIALTANAMPAEQTRVYESGMNDIMIKPINKKLMSTVISKWLNQSPVDKQENINYETDAVVFSLKEAEKFTEGNTTLALELTHMLKTELPGYQSKIAAALESKNYDELKSQTHKLHGAARCCGTPALCSAAAHMEECIDKQQYDALTTAARKLIHEISRLLAFPIDIH
jgi:two-component system, NarL family, sensor histidine kinase BarA